MSTRFRFLVPAVLLSCACACKAAPTGGAIDRSGQDAAAAVKAEKRAVELEQARLQLQIAEMEVASAAEVAAEAVAKAQRELNEAELALQRFGQYERPTQMAESTLSLDRATHSRMQDEQELQQMEAMYAAEKNLDADAERTRDMVLERHRKALEFSTRQLELVRLRAEDLEARELPRKEREVATKVEEARSAVRKAEEKLRKGELEGQLALIKARARVAELERGDAPGGKGGEEEGGR